MRRRDVLSAAALIAAQAIPTAPAYGARRPQQRVRPADPAWPNESSWDALRRQLHGSLSQPAPLFTPCGSAQQPACENPPAILQNPYLVGDSPSGTQVSGWVDAWRSAPSAYVVAAANTADVVAAVNFAREHNLRIVVKGGGHSYQGTSNAADSLLIWTRAMNAAVIHDAFVPGGALTAPVEAVSLGAGAVWMDAYHAVTTEAGRYVQGGGCGTVGVAGLVQSGGFGSNSKAFGTAASNLLEAEIVTADGVARVVNAHRHPDLFWAIKGGGGGAWGVVTRVTLKTHALPQWFGGAFGLIRSNSDDAQRRLIARFVAFYAERLFGPHWGEQAKIGHNGLRLSMELQGLTNEEIAQTWRPFFDWVQQSPQDYTIAEPLTVAAIPARRSWDPTFWRETGADMMRSDPRPGAPAWHGWWAGDQAQLGEFIWAYHSTWLPQNLLRADAQQTLVDALFAASQLWTVGLHFNKGLAGGAEAAIAATRETATNRAACDAFALAIISGGGPSAYPGMAEPDFDAARTSANRIDAASAALRRIVPHPGSYVSESSFFEPDWRHAFWGDNYARLHRVKRRYDPDGLFFVHHGVGSEDWSDDGFTRVR